MYSLIKRNIGKIIFFFFFFVILFANTLHEEYPDEYDNILGGKFIVEGVLPYSGFFSHHGPVPYFLSAFLYLFSGASFVKFRIFYSIFLFLYSLATYLYLRRSIGKSETNFYLFFLGIVGLASTYFWGHMLIADNLSSYLIVPVIVLIILKVMYKKLFTFTDLIFISVLLSSALLSALTVMYLVLIVYAFCFYLYTKGVCFEKITKKNTIYFLLIMIAPYVVFALYLFVTQSFYYYAYQNVILNQKYYIYNYPGSPNGTINPVRYAIVIFHNFYYSFTSLLFQIKDFNFGFPFNITLAISNVALVGYLFLRRHYMLAIFLILSLVFANARSSPLESSEKDYQASVYIMISLFSMCFFLLRAFVDLRKEDDYVKKVILTFFFVSVGVYSFFNIEFIFGRFEDKVFQKYMGNKPLIYDRPELAPLANKIVGSNDYVWIGPLNFKEYLYIDAKIPTKYHFLIPAMGRSEEIKIEIINEFMKNKPKIIFFDKHVSILGSNSQEYAGFFLDFLRENYLTLYDYRQNGLKYESAIPISSTVDLETKMYISRESVNDVISRMLYLNLIKEAVAK